MANREDFEKKVMLVTLYKTGDLTGWVSPYMDKMTRIKYLVKKSDIICINDRYVELYLGNEFPYVYNMDWLEVEEFSLVEYHTDMAYRRLEELFEEYDGNGEINRDAIKQIVKDSLYNKKWIADKMENVEGWDKFNLRLVRDEKYTRVPDRDVVKAYLNMINRDSNIKYKNLWNKPELENMMAKLTDKETGYRLLGLKNKTVETYNERKHYTEIFRKLSYRKDKVYQINNYILQQEKITNRIDEKLEEYFNSLDDNEYIKARQGQKITKAVRKYQEWANIPIDNKSYAEFCDAINEIQYTRPTVLSLAPIDLWTQSIGHNWHSCHDIRNGCYRAGSTSYVLDSSTVILYTVEKKLKSRRYEKMGKINRQLFHFGEDMFLQGRLYPQTCDSSDFNDDYATYRAIVQLIHAKAFDKPNLWTVSKGGNSTRANHFYTGNGYDDLHYEYNGQLSVSKYKFVTGEIPKIHVGEYAKCLCCGEEMESDIQDDMFCHECGGTYQYSCDNCGDGFNEYDDDVVFIDTRYSSAHYCCPDCAREDGYEWAVDSERWLPQDEVYEDHYTGEHFEYDDYMVNTKEYHCYMNKYNAEQDGNVYCENISNWADADNAMYDNYKKSYYYIPGYYDEDYFVYTNDGNKYISHENATADGYVYCVDTENWIKEEDAYHEDYEKMYYENVDDFISTKDGNTYRNEENAIADGYVHCEDTGNWLTEEDAYYEDYEKIYYENGKFFIFVDSEDERRVYKNEENAIADGCIYSELLNELVYPSACINILGEFFPYIRNAISKGYKFNEDLGIWYMQIGA